MSTLRILLCDERVCMSDRLIQAALAFREKGVVPPGVDEPTVYHQRSGGLLINDADRDNWFEVTATARAAFVEHSEEELRASVHGA